jgi:putative transposase
LTEIGAASRQQTGRWLNNRVENSHLPSRCRERVMQRFRRMKTLQKFASVHGTVLHNHFGQERHLISRTATGRDGPRRWLSVAVSHGLRPGRV